MSQEADDDRPLVLITGAAGLIGTHVIAALSDAYRIVALDITKPADESIEFFECDLSSDEDTHSALLRVRNAFGRRIASVIHLAAHYDFTGAPSPLYEQITVDGTRRILRELNENFETEQFVFASTILVMKPAREGQLLDEWSKLSGEWDYPASKIRAEAVVEEARGAIPTVILRLAGCYDEGGHSPQIAQQIWRIRERKLESHFFPGNAEHGQSFVHLEDMAWCFRRVVDVRATLGTDIFLIGEPETHSYAQLQTRIGELLHGQSWATVRIPAPVAKAGAWLKDQISAREGLIKPWMIDLADAHYPISTEHARDRLGWNPEHRLIDSLADMIQQLQRDPATWYRENDLPVDSSEATRDYEGLHNRAT